MKFIFTFLLISYSLISTAQRCATSEYLAKQPVSTMMKLQGNAPNDSRDTLPNEVIVIPVVFHVLYNNAGENISTEQIMSQLKVLNDDFRRLNADTINTPLPFRNVAADTRIVFCLAKVDPQGKYTTGIVRKFTNETTFLADDAMKFSAKGGDDAWDASTYLNIWICNLFGRTLGYSVLPGTPADKDGIVLKYTVCGITGPVRAPYDKGRTLTHETGHWLGLQHLWGDENCGDDGIADTPPQEGSNSECSTFPELSSCSINQFGDMFMNFMDFSDDACMNLFTQGQKTAMRSLFAKGNLKNSFLNAMVCDSTNADAGSLPPPIENDVDKPIISVYPNPFVNKITIDPKSEDQFNGRTVKLYSITGRLIKSQVLTNKKNTLYVDNLPSGMYLLKIEGPGKNYIFKIMKQP